MKRAKRFSTGSVVFDKRRRTWNLYYTGADRKRRSALIGSKSQYPTKSAAQQRALQMKLQEQKSERTGTQPEQIVSELVKQFRVDRMPKRISTRRSYESRLKNHILPKWGECPIGELKAGLVKVWLKQLTLAGKSKAHLKSLLRRLIECEPIQPHDFFPSQIVRRTPTHGVNIDCGSARAMLPTIAGKWRTSAAGRPKTSPPSGV